MQIQLNGEGREVPDGLNVPGLLEHLGLNPARVAIERNLEILPRAQWPVTQVAPGDRFEIVHFVGGGSRMVQASGTYELAELTAATKMILSKGRFRTGFLQIFGGVAVVGVIIVAIFRPAQLGQVWPAAIVGVLFLVLPQLLPGWVVRQQWKANPSLRSPHQIQLSSEGVVWSAGNARTEYRWNGFVSWREDEHSFYLFRSPMQPVVIPKRFFSSQGDIDEFRSLAGSMVSK